MTCLDISRVKEKDGIMAQSKTHPKLPAKCANKKAAYMPLTKWWCSFCAPTGGKV
jgi:hypothetical protein